MAALQPAVRPSPAVALAPELEDLRQQFERIADDAAELGAALSEAQFTWRPVPGVWSAAECLDHLNVAAGAYLPQLDAGIAGAALRSAHAQGPFKPSWAGRLLLHTSEPPSRIRLPSPHLFQPRSAASPREVLATFRAYQTAYVERLYRANGLDLGRVRVSSPVSRWLRFSLGTLFALIASHERRHLSQARRLLTVSQFPH